MQTAPVAEQAPLDLYREMGFSHAEFKRALQRTYKDAVTLNEHGGIVRTDQGGSVEITLGPERRRRIALLEIPVTDISFVFHDFSLAERDRFMQHFELYFRRGGG